MNNGQQPAFPCGDPDRLDYKEGLTKREYFAAMAMQGILAGINGSHDSWAEFVATATKSKMSVDSLIAKNSIEAADELLKQLNP